MFKVRRHLFDEGCALGKGRSGDDDEKSNQASFNQ